MSSSDPIITFDQIKGTIGSLVWLWSGIERELANSIRLLNAGDVSRSTHGIHRSLGVWSDCIKDRDKGREPQIQLCLRFTNLLMDALAIRNLVCHGLIGISAQLHTNSREAHLAVELSNDKRILTWSELQEMFAWMSQASWLISDLTAAALDSDAARGNDRIVAWQDFPRQR